MNKAHRSAFLASVFVVAALVLGACASAGPPPAQVKAQKSFDFNRQAAVQIQVFADVKGENKMIGLGSGVYLGINGMVMSNQHVAVNEIPEELVDVIKNPTLKVCLVTDEGATVPCVPAEAVALDEVRDLALLRTTLPSQAPIRIRPLAEKMNEAEPVYARLSFGEYLAPRLVYGRYVGHSDKLKMGEGRDPKKDLYDIAAMPGSSGGPVFDLQGHLVGLIEGGTTETGRVFGIVIPSKVIREFLAEHPEFFYEHEKLYP
jgi:S1-C subfamily serine protease